MTILLESRVPETGHLTVHVHADVQINFSAREAQRRVTQFVHAQISSQMHGETPVLNLRERAQWRVPVHLTFPSVGDAGAVGAIQVDVETGELDVDNIVIQEIEANAENLARRLALAPAR
jgi:hypothetical protein